ncbi:MAG: alpha/beta hydrolase [Caldilineaceae bacterium]
MSFLLIGLISFISIIALLLYSGPRLDDETLSIIDETLNEELPELIQGQTGFVLSNNVNIWYEFISPTTPTNGVVCLLMSNAADGLLWPPSLINRFTSAGFAVLRFDYRGTGQSDWMANWSKENAYSLNDMATDVTAIMDALDISRLHLFGFSLGGMIAQEIAINYPDRVLSLTLLMTTGDATDSTMNVLSMKYIISSLIRSIPIMRYRIMGGERNLIIERILKMRLVLDDHSFDVKETAQQVLYDVRKRRGINIKAVSQHVRAVAISGSRYDKLKSLTLPTLIIHGTNDKIFPLDHGKKLAALIPNAQFIWLDGVGHMFPIPNMDAILTKVIEHMSAPQ